ncbi:NAD(P)H-hydrate dehydratase [Litoreibacter arenae]|uniref:ADP-dependent (S)-NAD(P)H-hydrate dehydratase n=1 Tax=Litoreibacter arenae DSM 19593 TaxID=1123360 RepID=S9QFG0_9RHOB|nr:NAD(P)H-hydrate dehydratase [Litoreibacter arenae]EPX80161.1 NAD(P)HX epimerase / NAD(P)HX dehydratase [Litoreibacter arenae DSM 19593]
MTVLTMTPERIDSLRKRSDQHKFDHGSVLVLSGPATRTGAARLAAMAALRVGAGLVTVGAPRDALPECAAHLTGIMLREVSEALDLSLILAEDQRINALCIGPGFGLEPANGATLRAALATHRAVVLDADALTLMAQDRELFTQLHGGCVLTPHAGEFRRLFPGLGEDGDGFTLDEKKDATQRAADLSGAVVLYKGAQTTIAAPGCPATVLDTTSEQDAAWLATAGAGDVLAGLVTGLLARGNPPVQAAETGALLHAMAAREAGPGLIAEDLPQQIPGIYRRLGI